MPMQDKVYAGMSSFECLSKYKAPRTRDNPTHDFVLPPPETIVNDLKDASGDLILFLARNAGNDKVTRTRLLSRILSVLHQPVNEHHLAEWDNTISDYEVARVAMVRATLFSNLEQCMDLDNLNKTERFILVAALKGLKREKRQVPKVGGRATRQSPLEPDHEEYERMMNEQKEIERLLKNPSCREVEGNGSK